MPLLKNGPPKLQSTDPSATAKIQNTHENLTFGCLSVQRRTIQREMHTVRSVLCLVTSPAKSRVLQNIKNAE